MAITISLTHTGTRRTRPRNFECNGVLFCVLVTVGAAVMNAQPGLVQAVGPPSFIELYFSQANSSVVAAAPSGDPTQFGTISVFNQNAREAPALDAPVVGQAVGQRIIAKDGSEYVTYTYVLNISGFAGSISGQGVYDYKGDGALSVEGGTGDFVSATGYITPDFLIPGVLVRSNVYLEYYKRTG